MTKSIIGTVIKKSGELTISVLIERSILHPIYGKKMTRSTKILVHDPKNEGVVGEKITVTTSKPISKSKHHIVYTPSKTNKGKKND